MAADSKPLGYLWIEDVNTANYIVNLNPSSTNLNMTPK